MDRSGPGGRVRRVVIRSVLVVLIGGAVLAPILYFASTQDVQPPQVSRIGLTQHLPGDDGVALTTSSLEVLFSEPVVHTSAESAFRLTPDVSGAFTWSGATMIFTPVERLPLETSFSLSFAAGIRDLAGNTMGPSSPFAFRTVGGPTVVASLPSEGARDVPLDASVQLTFSTLMDTLSVERALQLLPRTEFTLSWSGERLTITPQAPLLPDQDYLVVVGYGAHDLGGIPLTSALHLSFTTVGPGLTAETLFPEDGVQGISTTTPIAVIFDRGVDPGSVNGNVLSIAPSVSGTLTVGRLPGAAGLGDSSSKVLLFTPSGPLPANTTFVVSVSTGARGADGSRMATPLRWTFTTGSPSSSLGNQIVFLSARSGVANLWAMNPDGSNQHELSAELSPVTAYAVAPDGRAFLVGDGVRLVRQRADGTERRVLTEAGALDFDPAYSPDGASIVFGRASAATGSGEGIWRRPSGGGSAELLIGPPASPEPTAASSPGASAPSTAPADASGGTGTASLLRAPVFSPDGAELAYVDMSGFVAIVDLRSHDVTRVPVLAVAPPAWLPDGDRIVVSGLVSGTDEPGTGLPGNGRLTPGTAVPPLTAVGIRLSAPERARVVAVQVVVGLPLVQETELRAGATMPAVAPGGNIAYLVLDPGSSGGALFVSAGLGSESREVMADRDGVITSASFAPDPANLIVARLSLPGTPASASPFPSPSPAASPTARPSDAASPNAAASPQPATLVDGIWLIRIDTGRGERLTTDGWLPRWIP